MKIAEEFGVAVIVTNQVVADPGAAAMFTAGINFYSMLFLFLIDFCYNM